MFARPARVIRNIKKAGSGTGNLEKPICLAALNTSYRTARPGLSPATREFASLTAGMRFSGGQTCNPLIPEKCGQNQDDPQESIDERHQRHFLSNDKHMFSFILAGIGRSVNTQTN
jgi:hypothetical protein